MSVREIISGNDQDVKFVSMVLHGRLMDILEKAGEKRRKTVQQLISEAIIEKAETMYEEDFPQKNGEKR